MKKVMKRIVALALVLTMALSTVIVSSAASKKAGKVTINATGVSVKSKTVTIAKKKSVTLGVAATKMKVKASKKGIVKVKASKKTIKVTGKKAGKTTLKISKKGYKTVKVTVKVAKKVTAIKPSTTSVEVVEGNSALVTTNKTVKVAKVSDKAVVEAKADKKNVAVKGLKEGAASFYVYDKSNAANYKKVSVKVTAAAAPAPAKTVVTPVKKDGKATYAIPADVKAIEVVTPNKTTITLKDAELKAVVDAVAAKTVGKTFADKTAKAGDKVTIAGKEATVKKAGEVLTYAGKDYTVVVDDAKQTATINGKTVAWTYDAAAGYTLVVDDKAGYTVSVVK